MALFTRKTSVLAKIESTYGTDAIPTENGNALVVSNVTLTPMELDTADRAIMQPYLGSATQVVVGQKTMLDFEVEITGAGTSAVTIPKFDALLQACGFAGVVNTTVSYDYTPVSSGMKSVTLYCFIDGIKHALVGAMGSVDFDFTTKQIPKMKFKFVGLYSVPTDSANPALVLTGWQTPVGVNNTNTTGFDIHGYAGVLQSLQISMNNTISYQNLVGEEYVTITDRKVSGQIVMKMPDTLAVKNWFIEAMNLTAGVLTLTHGTAAFNKFKVDCQNVQVSKPTYGDLEGVRTIQMQLTFIPTSAGNNEVKFSTL